MGEMIQFKRPDGKTCPGYLAPPKAGSSAPGFVVIQEWWGLNDQIKKTADRLAEAGYRALVPDFYRGKGTTRADHFGGGAGTGDGCRRLLLWHSAPRRRRFEENQNSPHLPFREQGRLVYTRQGK